MADEEVLCAARDGILVVTLNRAAKLNALTPTMLDGLHAAIEGARAEDVRAVLLRGAGRSFCSGADVHAGLGLTQLPDAHAFLSGLAEVLAAISSLPKPVIAALQGHCVGGGAELALEADLRIVADDAVLSFPDTALGSTPASAYQLVRHVGKSLASEMVMLGTALDARRMRTLGLATEVVPAEALEQASLALAERLRDRAGAQSLRYAKQAIATAEHSPRDADLGVNLAAMLACQAAPRQRDYVGGFAGRGAGEPLRNSAVTPAAEVRDRGHRRG